MTPVGPESATVLAAVALERAEEDLRRARLRWKAARVVVNSLLHPKDEAGEALLARALVDEAACERAQRDAISALVRAHDDLTTARSRVLVNAGVGAGLSPAAPRADAIERER